MLKLTIESQLSGPLSVARVKARLLEIVDKSAGLEEAAHRINQLPGLATYRGSAHIAVHRGRRELIENGSVRLAIIL
jgi:hypothetical protein